MPLHHFSSTEEVKMRAQLNKEQSEFICDLKREEIMQKLKQKEDLLANNEKKRGLKFELNHEAYLLKVRNKEINIERRKRKEHYEREIIKRKIE